MPETRAIVRNTPLPPGLKGDLNKIFSAMVDRLVVTFPFGAPRIVFGGLEPTTDVGLWLKDGDKPYVWDQSLPGYKPANIEDSETLPFHTGSSTPTTTTPALWLKTNTAGTRAGWFYYNSATSTWSPILLNSGSTLNRPLDPENLEPYFDTTINTWIQWERSAWRTVSGTPGDIKFVDTGGTDYATVLADALLRNPGWEEVPGAYKGRSPVIAGSGSGLTARAPLASYGAETVTLTTDQIPAHSHTTSAQHGGGGEGGGDNADYYDAAQAPLDTRVWPVTGETGGGASHPNLPPSVAFVTIRKQ